MRKITVGVLAVILTVCAFVALLLARLLLSRGR